MTLTSGEYLESKLGKNTPITPDNSDQTLSLATTEVAILNKETEEWEFQYMPQIKASEPIDIPLEQLGTDDMLQTMTNLVIIC